MEAITIEHTTKTPGIYFNPAKGILEITGRSIPENPYAFYKPLIDVLNEYAAAPSKLTEANIQLEYFNTASSKCLLDMFKCLEGIYRDGRSVVINWIYEEIDEGMSEAGEDYKSIVNAPFFLKQLQLR